VEKLYIFIEKFHKSARRCHRWLGLHILPLNKQILEAFMQLDRKALETLAALDDAQLKFVINRLAVNMGVDIGQFDLNTDDAQKIRRILSSLTDADIALAQRQIDEKRRGRK
jgi:uncharacterized protein YjgD (DUF1641 family)